MRPSYIYWLHPDAESGKWLPSPHAVRERWGAEEIDNADLVHWYDANTPPSSNIIAEQLATALSEVTDVDGYDLGLSVLFVWDGIDSREGFLDECLEKTSEYLSVFRQVIDANIVQYEQLHDSRFEILLRLPRMGYTFDDLHEQLSKQKQWLEKMQDHVNPPGGQRAPLTRVWLLGGNNVDLQHKHGITVASSEEHDQLTAEVVTFWLESDLDSILDKKRIGASPYLSIGLGRLLLEAGTCRQILSSRMGSRLLHNVLNGDARSPDPEECDKVMSGIALGADIRGISAERIGELFLNPRKLISDSPDYTYSDLGGQVLFDFEIDSTDLEDIDKCLELPASVMLQGRMLVSNRLYEGMKRVRECRMRAFNDMATQLKTIADHYTKGAGDGLWSCLKDRLSGWRAWIADQTDRIPSIASGLMLTDAESSSPIETYLNSLFQSIESTQDLVAEDKPDPKKYAAELHDVLSKRPLAEAFIARSIIGAVAGTWIFAHLLTQIASSTDSWLFQTPWRWILVALLPVTWGLTTYLKLLKHKKRRSNALTALMISIIKNGKWLFRSFISSEMSGLYTDVASFVGSEDDLAQFSSRSPELEEIASRKSCRAQNIATILSRSLMDRVGRLRYVIAKASESLAGAVFEPLIKNTRWVRNVADSDAASEFPFLMEPVDSVSSDLQRPFRDIYDLFQNAIEPMQLCWSSQADDASTSAMIAERASSWASTNGYTYLTQSAVTKLFGFLSSNDDAVVNEWREFLEKAAHPYFNLGSNVPKSRIGIIHPEGDWNQLDDLLQTFPDNLGSHSWTGTPGIVACCIQGPARPQVLPMLPIKFPDLTAQRSGADSSVEVEEI